MENYKQLRRRIKSCRRCELCEGVTKPVPGSGSLQPDIMFIGEAPGRDEDSLGVPFVGSAGQLLDKIIAAMGYKDQEVYKTNVVKCRPPDNRIPHDTEVDKCFSYLEQEVFMVCPDVIVTLGSTPLTYVLGKRSITKERGAWHLFKDIYTMPTYHPSFLIRKPEKKEETRVDMQHVLKMLNYKKQGESS